MEYGFDIMTSLTTRWFVLKEWVVELGATNTAEVTCVCDTCVIDKLIKHDSGTP